MKKDFKTGDRVRVLEQVSHERTFPAGTIGIVKVGEKGPLRVYAKGDFWFYTKSQIEHAPRLRPTKDFWDLLVAFMLTGILGAVYSNWMHQSWWQFLLFYFMWSAIIYFWVLKKTPKEWWFK